MFQSDFTQSIKITVGEHELIADSIPWNPHAKFKGVYLKHLVTGIESSGLASFHLVKIDPDCALDQHTHPGKWELHEVI